VQTVAGSGKRPSRPGLRQRVRELQSPACLVASRRAESRLRYEQAAHAQSTHTHTHVSEAISHDDRYAVWPSATRPASRRPHVLAQVPPHGSPPPPPPPPPQGTAHAAPTRPMKYRGCCTRAQRPAAHGAVATGCARQRASPRMKATNGKQCTKGVHLMQWRRRSRRRQPCRRTCRRHRRHSRWPRRMSPRRVGRGKGAAAAPRRWFPRSQGCA